MKRITLLLLISLFALSCRETQDTRYFAPDVEFGDETYTASAESGAVDVLIRFSRPAPIAFQIGLNFSGTLQEDVQYRVPSHTLDIAAGASEAKLRIELIDDEIWEEASWIDVSIAPGNRYTVNPKGICVARVNVTKAIVLPTLQLVSPEGDILTNPFRAETFHFELKADKAPSADLPVSLALDGLVSGTDYLISGNPTPEVVLAAGQVQASFDLSLLQKDESGCDRHAPLSIVPQKGVYVVSSDAGSVDIHLSDPSVDLSRILSTPANNNGVGYQLRQAILGAAGTWNGNLAADFDVSSQGSNYLRNFRNMYDSSWGCKTNSSGGNALRLTEFFPAYAAPSDIRILDYGAGANTRFFSPVDSLMRLVLDKGETQKGDIVLTKPRTFIAFIGDYNLWQEDFPSGKAWHLDSKATGGDISASTSPILTGRISVTLERLEGRFDLGNRSETFLFTAWFRSDSPLFMDGVDPETFAVSEEDGLWKVDYKLWPR